LPRGRDQPDPRRPGGPPEASPDDGRRRLQGPRRNPHGRHRRAPGTEALNPRRRLVPAALGLFALAGVIAPVTRASVVPWMGLDEITRAAAAIVAGTVASTESAWADDGRIILTSVSVTVDRALKGGPRATITLDVPGGRVGGQTLVA